MLHELPELLPFTQDADTARARARGYAEGYMSAYLDAAREADRVNEHNATMA